MSKRGKEKSRGKDARDIEDVRRVRERKRKKCREIGTEGESRKTSGKRETANKRSRICVEMRGSEGGGDERERATRKRAGVNREEVEVEDRAIRASLNVRRARRIGASMRARARARFVHPGY